MSEINIEQPLASLKEWRSAIFPAKSTLASNGSYSKSNPTEMAVLLANKSIESLRKDKNV